MDILPLVMPLEMVRSSGAECDLPGGLGADTCLEVKRKISGERERHLAY